MFSWIQAFSIQLIIYLLFGLSFSVRYLGDPSCFDYMRYKKISLLIITIMWLGFGTYYRRITEWPLLGVYGYIYNHYI